MAIEIISQNEGSRINHPVYKDVYNVTYTKGVITEFEVEDTDETAVFRKFVIPFIAWKFTDRVKLDISDDEWIPLFYHCKLHCYDDDVASLRDNGALNGSAYAFEVGDEVNVLLEEGVPKYVVGHVDNKPRMGAQYFKFSVSNNPHYSYSNPIIKEETVNETPTDYYEDTPNCDQLGSIADISRLEGSTDKYHISYNVDWCFLIYFVKVGPVLYIFWMRTEMHRPTERYNFPNLWGDMRAFSGVWSKSLEDTCKALSSTSSWLIEEMFDSYLFSIDHWAAPTEFDIYNIPNPYPADMKEQRYYSDFEQSEDRDDNVFGIFWARYRNYYFSASVIDFRKVKMEGQSYYEKE